MIPNAHDRRVGARALGAANLALGVAILVIAATDEGGPWSMRLGMLSALAPAAGMLGALAAVRISAARGENRALAAMGVDPMRAATGAAAGGAIVGAMGPAIAASGVGDLAALFPRALAAHTWIADGDGMRERALGVRVGLGGAISLEAPQRAAEPALATSTISIAVLSLAVAAIACPLWIVAAEGAPLVRRTSVLGLVVVIAIVAFQAVAAGRAPPIVLVAAPVVLLADVVLVRVR